MYREMVTRNLTIAHDRCQQCAQCQQDGGIIGKITMQKEISPILFLDFVSLQKFHSLYLHIHEILLEAASDVYFWRKMNTYFLHKRTLPIEFLLLGRGNLDAKISLSLDQINRDKEQDTSCIGMSALQHTGNMGELAFFVYNILEFITTRIKGNLT